MSGKEDANAPHVRDAAQIRNLWLGCYKMALAAALTANRSPSDSASYAKDVADRSVEHFMALQAAC